jgi:2'-hydroxyisoflavone reductase
MLRKQLTFLILGGTQFLGRHLVQEALERGHRITLFNRGQTNPDLYPQVEKLRGNRNGDLRALEGRKWDAVIDTCGFVSRNVGAVAKLLAGSIGHYTFVSSVSVYRDFSRPGLIETDPLEQLAAGVAEEERDSNTYGARKALCERIAEEILPGKVLTVRAGLIVGPHDTLGRFTYWVRRATFPEEVLGPGDPNAPVQLIDVRDLSGWIIRMAENGETGAYNATGPSATLSFLEMLEQCQAASGIHASVTWVENQFLLENNVEPFRDRPFWLPLKTHEGFFAIDCRRAFASGLVCRPLVETARDTLDWGRASGDQVQVGLTMQREQELLQIWRRKCLGG